MKRSRLQRLNLIGAISAVVVTLLACAHTITESSPQQSKAQPGGLKPAPSEASKEQKAKGRECKVEITSPKPGGRVTSPEIATGTATIPDDGYLWVLAHKEGWQEWWPQGAGPAKINDDLTWKVLVHYGSTGERGRFEVTAAVVNRQTNEKLMKWVEEAPAKGFPSIPFPESIYACPSIKPVVVEKY